LRVEDELALKISFEKSNGDPYSSEEIAAGACTYAGIDGSYAYYNDSPDIEIPLVEYDLASTEFNYVL
jgi:hypothetical protein